MNPINGHYTAGKNQRETSGLSLFGFVKINFQANKKA